MDRTPAPPHLTLLPGGGGSPALRPVVLGEIAASNGHERPPELAVAVGSDEGAVLGWVVVDRTGPPCWGGVTASPDLTLEDARLLARATALQAATYGLDAGSHHALVRVDPAAPAAVREHAVATVLRAAAPLGLDPTLRHDERAELAGPTTAVRGALAASSATLDTALRRAGRALAGSSCLVVGGGWLAGELTATLEDAGAGCTRLPGLPARAIADVVLLAGHRWTLDLEAAAGLRASVVAALAPGSLRRRADEELREHGAIVLPEALLAGGALVAVAAERDGAGPGEAVEAAATAARARTDALLAEAETRAESVAAVARGLLRGERC
ncbi:MAG: hypothetical protein R3C15_05945 [Thermoleophilia bacterium]